MNARRGAYETLVRAAAGIAAVVSLIFGAAAPALAEVPSPPPPEPVAGCDWYGELTESVAMEYVNEPQQSTQERLIEKVFSSQDAEGEGCAAFYSETYYDDFLDEGTDWCDPSPVGGDEYLAPTSYRVTLEGETSGTGGLTAVIDDNAGSPEIRVHGTGAAYEVASTTVGIWPCGHTETGTTTVATAAVNSEVGFTDDCSAETAVPNLSVQVVLGTCTVTTVADHGPGAATTETITWTWRFAREVCDVSVDTDGGGVGDCAEFEQQTDPSDPADDTPLADSDGDGVKDGSDQCPGTPAGEPVDANGCPIDLDSDGDGIPDESDQCADTPSGVPVDVFGCTLDSDGDGVHDGLDQCAATPAGAPVDTDGCALDEDGDGVHDGIDQCTGTPAGFPVDADGCALDSDGDGVYDGTDVCPDTPLGTPVNAVGCEEGSNDCVGPNEARGYTVAHYDADLTIRRLPDPDFFDWEVSASWCVVDDRVRFASASSYGAVTLNTAIATALDLVGVTLRYDTEDEGSFVTPLGGTTTGSVEASADFEVCVRPLDLLVAGGAARKLGESLSDNTATILGSLPKNGDVAPTATQLAGRVDDALGGSTDEIVEAVVREADPKSLDRTTDRAVASDLWERVSGLVDSEVRDPSLLFDVAEARRNLTESADEKLERFLAVYSDGEQITIPKGERKAASEYWNQLVLELSGQSAQYLLDRIAELTWCGTVWHPELTIYIPQSGESFVDDGQIDGSLFDVRGGISIDTRPES
ncbi:MULTISPECIES: thrombospondin type 3 repeat-containing protein [unclassified Agromyces]|uniref:thrombospondin type 3 repeat-containing protein n=1 Tax=unclassified Agromyces TaxID=2639701 RepID=UPI003015676D